MRQFSAILIVACLLSLSACSTRPAPAPSLDQSLLEPCPPLQPIPADSDGMMTVAELYLSSIDTATEYRICARRHAGLVDALKRAEDGRGSQGN